MKQQTQPNWSGFVVKGHLFNEFENLFIGKVVLVQNDYNELGQLMLKKLHMANDTSYVQDIDYLYDIRGWLKSINNMTDTTYRKLYAQSMNYYANGNISTMNWKNTSLRADSWVIPTNKQSYGFTYDGLNRLTTASYSETDPLGAAVAAKSGFFDENPTYDLNGNMGTLARQGNTLISGFNKGLIDNLGYTYLPNSNQIASITDTGVGAAHNNELKPTTGTFAYDANGNTTYAPHKQATLAYNYLNLPNSIAINGQGTINYTYDAAGNKLVKTFGTTTSYYQGNVLKIGDKPIVLTGEGRAVNETTGWNYEYDLKDHLGNTRISFGIDTTRAVPLQTIDYYPFGLEMANNHLNLADATKFRYAGKEIQDEGGLNWIDFSARLYDQVVPHFLTPDPLAEKIPDYTPYNYVRDNPINKIDPTGKWDVTVHLYNNRAVHGYGVAIVTDRFKNEIYRFNVRAEGTGGRNWKNDHADTPLGVYDIPNKNMWKSSKSDERQSYGPNDRLLMNEESGDIITSGRTEIRIHGGQQEIFNKTTGKWEPKDNPELEKTWGCLRAADSDMDNFKNATDELMSNDPLEYAGKVTVLGDLKQKKSWKGVPYRSDQTNTTYHAPGEDASDKEKQDWNTLVNSILNR